MNSYKKKLIISNTLSFIDVMKAMDEGGEKILFVIDSKSKLTGCITDGDIRRWILDNGTFDSKIKNYYNPNPIYIYKAFNLNNLKKKVIKERLSAVPILNDKQEIIDILLSEEIIF